MTGTMAGADAFWVERVKKEVKTSMRHQEHYDVVKPPAMIDFYKKVSSNPNKQATQPGKLRYANPETAKGCQMSKKLQRVADLNSFAERRASTPNRMLTQEQQTLQATKSKQMYRHLLQRQENASGY